MSVIEKREQPLLQQFRKVAKSSVKILSLRGIVHQTEIKQDQIAKPPLKEISKNQEILSKEDEEQTSEKEEKFLKEKIKNKVTKYKLNIETDSEEENEDNINSPSELNFKQKNKDRSSIPNVKLQGYLDNQITLGAIQTKAKLNANLLFGIQGEKPIASSASRILLKRNQQNPLVLTNPAGVNAQYTLNNEGNSLSSRGGESRGIVQNNQMLTSINQQIESNSYTKHQIQNNSLIYEDNEENIVFLKGLSQNQQLGENCELKEQLENEKMSISIRTTDFFTFIRLEDEVDELRRKHFDFKKQQEVISKQMSKQSLNKLNFSKQLIDPLTSPYSENKSPTISRSHKYSSAHQETIPKSLVASKIVKEEDIAEKIPKKSEGQDFYAIVQAKKFVELVRAKTLSKQILKNNKAFVKAHELNQLEANKKENKSLGSSFESEENKE